MVLTKPIKLVGSKGESETEAIFDGGSTYSCIRKELAERLASIEPLPEVMVFETTKEGEKVEAKERVSLNFYVNGLRLSDEFMVIEDLSDEVLIGATTMQKWRMKLDYEKEEVIIDPAVTRLRNKK